MNFTRERQESLLSAVAMQYMYEHCLVSNLCNASYIPIDRMHDIIERLSMPHYDTIVLISIMLNRSIALKLSQHEAAI